MLASFKTLLIQTIDAVYVITAFRDMSAMNKALTAAESEVNKEKAVQWLEKFASYLPDKLPEDMQGARCGSAITSASPRSPDVLMRIKSSHDVAHHVLLMDFDNACLDYKLHSYLAVRLCLTALLRLYCATLSLCDPLS